MEKNSGRTRPPTLCRFLEEAGFLHHAGGAWHWTSESYPGDAVSLRAVTSDNFVVVDVTGEPKVIAEVALPCGAHYAPRESHLSARSAPVSCRPIRLRGTQGVRSPRGVRLLHGRDRIHAGKGAAGIRIRGCGGGRARHMAKSASTRQIVGFKKIKFYTLENVGAGKLSMPEQEMHTTAFWLHFPAPFLDSLDDLSTTEKQNGLTGLGNALRSIAALRLMCDPRDLGVALGSSSPAAGIRA